MTEEELVVQSGWVVVTRRQEERTGTKEDNKGYFGKKMLFNWRLTEG